MLRLAVVAVVAALLVATNAHSVCHSKADNAGVLCDNGGGRNCPSEEAACDANGACACAIDGAPEMLCANSVNDHFASIINDPTAHTIDNKEDADLPVPCAFLFSAVRTTNEMGRNGNPSKCTTKVFLHNERATDKGKIYVRGFRVEISTTNTVGGDKNMVFQGDSTYDAANSEYCYNYAVSKNGGQGFQQDPAKFLSKDPFKIGMAPYTFTTNTATNQLKLQVPHCGISVVLRAADQTASVFDQEWMPGAAILYDHDKFTKFLEPNDVVSLVPSQSLSLHPQDRTGSEHLTYRAFTGPGKTVTNYPNHSSKCASVSETLAACPGNTDPKAAATSDALHTCSFILAKSRFLKCYSNSNDNNVDLALELYNKCVEMTCNRNVVKCMAFRQTLQNIEPSCKIHAEATMVEHPCTFDED